MGLAALHHPQPWHPRHPVTPNGEANSDDSLGGKFLRDEFIGATSDIGFLSATNDTT